MFSFSKILDSLVACQGSVGRAWLSLRFDMQQLHPWLARCYPELINL
jgi:hypothetical protein